MQVDLGQRRYDTRMDWGLAGATACAADLTVVVDVLSFSTTVSVAVERGTAVFPCQWDDFRARALAEERSAVVAVGRLEAVRDGVVVAPSLSPAALASLDPVPRLVLPSPNGSTLTSALAASGTTVLAGCLRNAHAVAEVAARSLGEGRSVAVVAAGERWPDDGSLRPSLEDHLGAGAVLAALARLAPSARRSPEADAAAALFDVHATRLTAVLLDCVGGRELADRGFEADVTIAAELDVTDVVPVMVDGAFTPFD